jgi:hypothetical protein
LVKSHNTYLKGTRTSTKSDNFVQGSDKLALIGGVAGALLLLLLLLIAVVIIILIYKAIKSKNKQPQLINELSRYISMHRDLDLMAMQ